MRPSHTPRLLIVPGLHDSGPTHWQTWLQGLYRHSVRVVQDDWHTPDLLRWSAGIADTLARAGPGPWIAAGHSFGCLALAHHLARHAGRPPEASGGNGSGIQAALLVAPADPERFGLAQQLPQHRLPVMSTVVASQTDPWMTAARAHHWATRWGSHFTNLGEAGHINAEAGFGTLPLARRWVMAVAQRLARERRPTRAELVEWRFAV